MKRNIQNLRTDLVELFYKLEKGQIKAPVAVEMNNAAGKAINAAKLELEYIRMKDRAKNLNVDFMETEDSKEGKKS
jgi:GTP cyclohydrolase III